MIREPETLEKGGAADPGAIAPALTREAIAEDLSAGVLFPDEVRIALNILRKTR